MLWALGIHWILAGIYVGTRGYLSYVVFTLAFAGLSAMLRIHTSFRGVRRPARILLTSLLLIALALVVLCRMCVHNFCLH